MATKRAPRKIDPVSISRKTQLARIKALRKRDRLLPCIEEYDALIVKLTADGVTEPERAGLAYLTGILRGTYATVLKQISNAGKTGINAQNAVKRSAGTNFQGLCEYAILRWLQTSTLPVAIGPNAPKSMKDELTIFGPGPFTANADLRQTARLIEADGTGRRCHG